MSYFAVALARTDDGWTGRELDLDEVDDLEALAEELRDFSGDSTGPALLLLEEDDEYVGLVRVDGGIGSLDEPRVFLSDRRAVTGSGVSAMLWDVSDLDEGDDHDDDEDEGTTRWRSRSAMLPCSPISVPPPTPCSTCALRRGCCPPTSSPGSPTAPASWRSSRVCAKGERVRGDDARSP